MKWFPTRLQSARIIPPLLLLPHPTRLPLLASLDATLRWTGTTTLRAAHPLEVALEEERDLSLHFLHPLTAEERIATVDHPKGKRPASLPGSIQLVGAALRHLTITTSL